MIKLIIDTPGLYIQGIKGLCAFRTPAEIDITKLNLSHLIIELRKNGVDKFKIVSEEEKIKKTEDTKPLIEKQIIKEKEKNESSKFDKKLNQIMDLLKQVVDRDISAAVLEPSQLKKKKEIRVDDEFIPTVDLTLKGEASFKTEERQNNILDAVRELASLTNKGDK